MWATPAGQPLYLQLHTWTKYKLAEKYNAPLLGQLPLDANIGVCADKGENFVMTYADSIATKIYENIADNL